MTTVAQRVCDHCGLPAVRPIHGRFCCQACQMAWRLIHAAGGEAYYGLRENPPLAAPGRQDPLPWDDPAFQATFVRTEGAAKEADLLLSGLHCPACIWVIEKVLGRIPGVEQVTVHYAASRVRLRFREVALSELATTLQTLGYAPSPYNPATGDAPNQARQATLLTRLVVAGFGSLALMFLTEPIYFSQFAPEEQHFRRLFEWAAFLVATPTALYAVWPFLRGAVTGLSAGLLTMDFTVALGALVTWGYSSVRLLQGGPHLYFDSLVMFLFLILLGRTFEATAKRKAFSNTDQLLKQTGQSARLVDEGEVRSVSPLSLKPGDLVELRPGDRVPADGVIETGDSRLDESMLTGEARPIHRRPGERVTAGSSNLDGSLRFRVSQAGAQTTLAQIVRMVEEADAHKAPIQRLADRIAHVFVLAVLLISAITFLALLPQGLDTALTRAVTVLIVTCPCALGLAIPAAMVLATAAGVPQGLLFKSGAALEQLPRLQHLFIDKTGTLTVGRMQVIGWESAPGVAQTRLQQVARALENGSEHPIAEAIRHATDATAPVAVERFLAVSGRGVEAQIMGQTALAGSLAFLAERGLDVPDRLKLDALQAARQGHTVVAVAHGDELLGLVVVGDALRDDARQVVQGLKARGVHVVMLTGDHPESARAIAKQAGIDELHAGLMPQDKQRIVTECARTGQGVAFVGDGLNDAPALSAADVGLAVSTGSDLTQAAADVLLLNPQLTTLVKAFDLAARTQRIIRQNLSWSLIYNLIAIPLAIAGWMTPLLAAMIMPLSSLVVVANALKLRRRPL